ncbi:hypothetical protein N0V90_005421 [Kalmusia sp. IMI 367209]|nr:hypothetical protein N0V90_005421 [Kalmusia sp. IMI 367209]
MASKRKRSSGLTAATEEGLASSSGPRRQRRPAATAAAAAAAAVPLSADVGNLQNTTEPPPPRRQPSRALSSHASTNPNANPDVVDGLTALRASPDNVVELAGVGNALKPRREKSTGGDTATNGGPGSTDATPAAPNALTEDSSIDVPAETHGHQASSSRRTRRPRNGLQGNASDAPAPPASETAAADVPEQQSTKSKRKRDAGQHVKVDSAAANGTITNATSTTVTAPPGPAVEKDVGVTVDPEGEDDVDGEDEVKAALSRPPPVNSDYLPLPWKGRIGYACLNTYLRNANPPVFSSRTCRIASILEHRHPLKDPSQPEHATKNRPDRDQPADVARGRRYVEEIGLANARDVIKMVRWNDRYGIKFMRLSSEMFPFASHDEYGYKLAPFAADTLAEVGSVVAELGHRVTTHPGQFTQLGSPRKQVIDNAIRDLEYHDEMLSLLKLPPQQDRDAVMILHLGGAFGDKPAAIERFKENYGRLSASVKNRLVLENDDVVWSVHEILPLCQELNIPMVLDFHHHNILFDAAQIREGTEDIVHLFPAILETWSKKNITPKMHYSEPCPDAVTARSRRKHSPRVMTLPPCPDTMDLMIEAKDKEQAVFELMRTFKLPGFDLVNDVIPHVRQDENKPWKPKPKKAAKKGRKKKTDEPEDIDAKIEEVEDDVPPPVIPEDEVGMGGPERRVYWPPGMEDWLRPPKRVVKKKEDADGASSAPATKKRKTATAAATAAATATANTDEAPSVHGDKKKAAPKRASATKSKALAKVVPTPSPSDEDSEPLSSLGEDDDADEGGDAVVAARSQRGARAPARKRSSGRASQRVSYKEEEEEEEPEDA